MVQTYAEYEEFSTRPVSRLEIPGPRTVLIIELAAPLLASGASEDTAMNSVRAFIGSPGRGPATTWHGGEQHCIEVRLTQLGAYCLLGSMHDLGGRIVPLASLWGSNAADALTARLVSADGWESRFDILDEALGAALSSGHRPDPEVAHAWARLESVGGNLLIGELLTETGWSRGRLARRFRTQTGLTPKVAASLMRFDQAVELLTDPTRSLASVAAACGYYDQAHLNRDFRSFADRSPTQWIGSQLDDLVGAGTT